MTYDPNLIFSRLEPLPGSIGSFYFFDDEQAALYVPVAGAPKGSARALPVLANCPTTGVRNHYAGMRFVNGSGDSTKKKLDTEERAIRQAVAALWHLGFMPYDDGCKLDLDLVYSAPKARRTERKHTTYPDRDKALRAVQDHISPPRENKAPVMTSPHLVVNDSQIHGGYCEKWWLHVWNEITGLRDDGDGIYIVLHY